MASLLRIGTLFVAAVALATSGASAAVADVSETQSAVIYTTGGQGFHRHLLMHVPLLAASADGGSSSSSTGSSSFSVTVHLRLRNTFFIDVAEAENLWDARLLIVDNTNLGSSKASLAEQFATAGSRTGAGFISSVALQHPITSIYPYDIEIPTLKTPYLFNEANVTFDFTVDKSQISASNGILAVLSIPIHERYEEVTSDPEITHVERCVEASDVKIYINNENAEKSPKNVGKHTDAALAKRYKHVSALPIHFTQEEDTAAIIAAVGTGGNAVKKSGGVLTESNTFCVKVPVGYLGDLPIFYWATMSCMVLGAVAVWAGLTTV